MYKKLLIILFFAGVFIFTSNPVIDPDTWFHLKAGEYISAHGIPHTDVFSQAGSARPWYPHEWLAEVIFYQYVHVFGLDAIKYLVGMFAVLQIGIFWIGLKKIFRLHWIWLMGLSLSYALVNYVIFFPRPQLLAMSCFILQLWFVLLYLNSNRKKYILMSIPLAYVWSMLHASVGFGIGLLFVYAVYSFSIGMWQRKRSWITKGSILMLVAGVSFIVSILPPSGMIAYKNMQMFTSHQDRILLSQFEEWQPLIHFVPNFIYYVCSTLFVFLLIIYLFRKHQADFFQKILLVVPVTGLIIFGFTNLRTLDYGFFGLLIFVAFFFSYIQTLTVHTKKYIAGIGMVVLCIQLAVYVNQRQTFAVEMPVMATRFLQQNSMSGPLLNDFNAGGYLIYQLYSNYKVFIDGRDDVYLCCELPEYVALSNSTQLSPTDYHIYIDAFIEKHNFQILLLPYRDQPYAAQMIQYLQTLPDWSLVYWDDSDAIFIQNKGVNRDRVSSLAIQSATPFSSTPYKEGKLLESRVEYMKMFHITPSALTATDIGITYYKENDSVHAEEYFKKAIQINPSFIPAYTSLGYMLFQQQKYTESASVLESAVRISPKKSLYELLSRVYEAAGNHDKAQQARDSGNRD